MKPSLIVNSVTSLAVMSLALVMAFFSGCESSDPSTGISTGSPSTSPPPGASSGPSLASGAGYELIGFGQYTLGNCSTLVMVPEPNSTANFASGKHLQAFRGPQAQSQTLLSATSSSGSTDGLLGWGYWTGGTLSSSGSTFGVNHLHYVIGKPTPDSYFAGLGSNVTRTYQVVAATAPATDPQHVESTPVVSGSLTVTFNQTANTTFFNLTNLTVDFGGQTYSILNQTTGGFVTSTLGTLGFSVPVPSTVGGSVSPNVWGVQGIKGIFVGPNAERIGLVYGFSTLSPADPNAKCISGAAMLQ